MAEDTNGARVLEEYRKKGFAGKVGFGSHPAVVVVDFIVGFTDPDSPLGSDLDRELDATYRLLETARENGFPVIFTTTAYDEELSDAGLFIRKIPSLEIQKRGSRWVEIDPRLKRQDGEMVVEKQYASAFFGTDLASILRSAGIDTVIVTGCTTSGCIRATVVDALQNGFHAIVPRECIGDRSEEQHRANLVDIDGKYGDVEDLATVIEVLRSAEKGSG